MATYNGREFIETQVESVLGQRGVDVRLFVADDASSDGTREWLEQLAEHDDRVRLVDEGAGGSAPKNFLRIAMHAPLGDADAVGFVDQDDIWFADKLERQWAQLQRYDAVSSDVIAMFPDRRAIMIRKSQTQRRFDFACESGGPGCTFLLRRAAFDSIVDAVRDHELLPAVPAHDWLFYAVARAQGLTWHIAERPTMAYRQHGHNVTGANIGAQHALKRGRQLIDGSFRQQCAITTRIAADAAPHNPAIAELATALEHPGAASNRALAKFAGELRRRPRDRTILRSLILSGLF